MAKVKAKKESITKDMLMADIIMKHPEVAPILMGYGLHCAGCDFAYSDTLEMGAKTHGMDKETMEMMLRDANTIVEKFMKARGKKD